MSPVKKRISKFLAVVNGKRKNSVRTVSRLAAWHRFCLKSETQYDNYVYNIFYFV